MIVNRDTDTQSPKSKRIGKTRPATAQQRDVNGVDNKENRI